ncbi:MAG: CvpA family protein [Kiritimatiellia bacterium]
MTGSIPTLATVDWCLLALALIFAVRGGIRGFSGEVGNLVALAISGVTLWYAWNPFGIWIAKAQWIPEAIRQSSICRTLILLISVAILFVVVYKATAKLVGCAIGQPLDAMLGVCAALFKVAFLAGIIFACGQIIFPRLTHWAVPESSVASRILAPIAEHFTGHFSVPH